MSEVVESVKQGIDKREGTNHIKILIIKWVVVIGSGVIVYMIPTPQGIAKNSWALLAIFIATLVGSIVRPLPAGAVVLMGVGALAAFKVMPVKSAFAGYSDNIVWLVLVACFLSRAMIDTGLGHRISLICIKLMGQRSLGLGYALVIADLLLALVIPSNGARSGGIIFPISRSIAETYDSKPGETAEKLGTFLMILIYQCEVIIGATLLTGHAANIIIRQLAFKVTGVDLDYLTWMVCGIVPGLVSLLIIPRLVYRLSPPLIKETPGASEFARNELTKMGPATWREKAMLAVFVLIAIMWATTRYHGVDYAITGLAGISILLILGVVSWSALINEPATWDLFLWFGGVVRMAEALGQTEITKRFAEVSGAFTTGMKWWWALAILALIYFYAHYGFASISAHTLALFTPFLIVLVGVGAPVFLSVAVLAFFSSLSAGLTHFGTTPGPIYFGAGYVSQTKWWRIGLIASVINILIWSIVGMAWWKLLGKF